MKKKNIVLFILLALWKSSFSQSNSFQMIPDIDTINYAEVLVNKEGDISVLGTFQFL